MQICTEQEALFLACEMETTAVQLYTRALQVMEGLCRESEPLYACIRAMLADEQGHLCRFRSLYNGMDADAEQQMTLAAVAEGLLFEGGLMGAARQGLFEDVQSLLKLAMEAERTSAERYRLFAAQAHTPEAAEALLRIAQEEDGHLMELEAAERNAQNK